LPVHTHNVFENVRTRVLVVHDGTILLIEGVLDGSRVLGPPGGGLELHESLAECAAREVREETGVIIDVGRVAFLREWVIPAYCEPGPEEPADAQGFGLEVYFHATPRNGGAQIDPASEHGTLARWVPLDAVPQLRVWPVELRSLAPLLAQGFRPSSAHSFVSRFRDLDGPVPAIEWR
jgi:phosphatase NudJ